MSEETPYTYYWRWTTTMAVKRIHAVVVSAYCTLMLASAGIAADGALLRGIQDRISLKSQAKIILNAGFTGGVKIPVKSAPAIKSQVEVAVNSPKKKGELQDLFGTVSSKGWDSLPGAFNRIAPILKFNPNGEKETIKAFQNKENNRALFVRHRADDPKPLLVFMTMKGQGLWLFSTSVDGVMLEAIRIENKTRIEKTAEEIAKEFRDNKDFWLDWVKKLNQKELADPK